MDIQSLQEFYCGFDITTPDGNNAFSYDQRQHKKVHVAPLIQGTLDDVKPGDEIVFSEVVSSIEVNTTGLHRFVYLQRPGQDIFIFDNHNHAFSCWAAGVEAGVIAPASTLVHVDQHKDTRVPAQEPFGSGPMRSYLHYANYVLNVGNFIPPAVELGWFKDVIQVGSQEAFENGIRGHTLNSNDEISVCPRIPFVLDIDLDIFAPDMDYIPDDLKIVRLREWIARASFITIATSPFFIEQPRALHYLRELLA